MKQMRPGYIKLNQRPLCSKNPKNVNYLCSGHIFIITASIKSKEKNLFTLTKQWKR